MKHRSLILLALFVMPLALGTSECDNTGKATPMSSSGVEKASVKVPVGPDGMTEEQRNIANRLKEDNKPGAMKHLYVISAYSGQVIIYSPVRGKVTSGGKRLTPKAVVGTDGQYVDGESRGMKVGVGGRTYFTPEVIQDDGTYGDSGEYLYWWDTKGIYHQHYIAGGQIVHVSSEPLAVKSIIINMALTQ
jgi:hypothetical protein